METEHRRRLVDGDVSRRRRDGSGDALEFWAEDPPSGIAAAASVGRCRFGWWRGCDGLDGNGVAGRGGAVREAWMSSRLQ